VFKVKALKVHLGFGACDLQFILLQADLSRELFLIFFLFGCCQVHIGVALLDLLKKLLLLIRNLFNKFEALIVANLKVASVANKQFIFIGFRKFSFILSAPVTDGTSASLAVMTAFFHETTKFLGQSFEARIALLQVFQLQIKDKSFWKVFEALILLPQFIVFLLLTFFAHVKL